MSTRWDIYTAVTVGGICWNFAHILDYLPVMKLLPVCICMYMLHIGGHNKPVPRRIHFLHHTIVAYLRFSWYFHERCSELWKQPKGRGGDSVRGQSRRPAHIETLDKFLTSYKHGSVSNGPFISGTHLTDHYCINSINTSTACFPVVFRGSGPAHIGDPPYGILHIAKRLSSGSFF